MALNMDRLNKFLDYLELKCVDNISKIKTYSTSDKISFQDKDGYLYFLNIQNLSTLYRRKTKPAIFFQHNIYTSNNIDNYLKLNNIPLKLTTKDPQNATYKMEWECLIHNISFQRSWNVIKNGSILCPECEKISFRESRCNKIKDIIEKALKDYNIQILANKYINNEEKLPFICNKHRDEGIQYKSWGGMITKSHPCIYCSKEKRLSKIRYSHDEFIEKVNKIHGDKYKIISNYIKGRDHIKVYCNKCNSIFSIRASHLLEGHGCGLCTKSIGEETIKNILDRHKIKYKREFRFNDCRKNKPLPFDFYLEDYNLCIEYQGVQHYKPVEIFGGIEQFNKQKENDSFKRTYCKTHNINLLEIPYFESNIEDMLLNKINTKEEF